MLLGQTASNTFPISRKTPLTSILSSKDLYILWVKEKSWLTEESPGLKPDWFEEIKLFSIRNFHKLEVMRLVCNFSNTVYLLSYELTFFHSKGNEPMLMHWKAPKIWDLPDIHHVNTNHIMASFIWI